MQRMNLPNVISRSHSVEQFIESHCSDQDRILNIGAGYSRFGKNCVNVDVQAHKDVDIVCDAHQLLVDDASFDICVLTAVLQYCREPSQVVREVHRVLKPGGYVYVDVPFIQPYCPDSPDLFRFTKHGLIALFERQFEIEECSISIPPGSALAFYVQNLVGNSGYRLIDIFTKLVWSFVVLPVSRTSFGRNPRTAGAFYLIAQKGHTAESTNIPNAA